MDTRALAIVGLATMCAYLWTLPAVDENGESDNAPDLLDYAGQARDYIEQQMEGGDEMNKVAFLQALRLGEGTADYMGYYRLCGGGECATLAAHPAALGWGGWRLPVQMAINAGFPNGQAVSTAAGAYQITRPTWNRVAVRLGLVDFSETSQDEAAWFLIGEKGAQADVLAGRIESAIGKLGGLWASLPGARGQQRQVSLAAFANEYKNSGGVWA
jgi:lysozyme